MNPAGAPKKTKAIQTKPTQAVAVIPKEKRDLVCCPPEKTKETAKSTTKKHAEHGMTKITVKFDCGFANKLFIRGEGIEGLSWEKGALMECVNSDEWAWETDKHFKNAKFKILVNDEQYETGENHITSCGKPVCVTPTF